MKESKKIIFFDGHCNFCNNSVDFSFKKNSKKNLYYSSLQSDYAKAFLPKKYWEKDRFDTIYFFDEGQIYEKSTAILKISNQLDGYLKHLSIFLFIPKSIRDFGYDFIAKRRYLIFGKSNTCRVTTPEEKHFFLA